ELYLTIPHKALKITNSQNCSGEYIKDSENCHDCYDISDCENVKYGMGLVYGVKDSYDITQFGRNVELCYNDISTGYNVYQVMFSYNIYTNNSNVWYSLDCWPGCSNLFGCASLRKKKNCILNKQYSKEEYEELVPKIIEHMQKTGEWGEFFPYEISSFGYNESEAYPFFPIKEEDAKKIGANWQGQDYGIQYDGLFYIPLEIKEYDPKHNPDAQERIDEALSGILKCEESGKPYRLISQEMAFCIEHGLAIPRLHPQLRHEQRFVQRRGRKLYGRKCDKCGVEVKTTFGPDFKGLVYCDVCYKSAL
ncbi:hypothetical protein KJ855_04550, partial [Patescibacteria group bacterium]|nr:hypothetical protein [Patescibacteria group bacterium]